MEAMDDRPEQHVVGRGACGECWFWEKPEITYRLSSDSGYCKRYPPPTEKDRNDWCGEYESRSFHELKLNALSKSIDNRLKTAKEFLEKHGIEDGDKERNHEM